MLAQPNLGLAKGPVFVTHQTENRQHWGLIETGACRNDFGSVGALTSRFATRSGQKAGVRRPESKSVPRLLANSEDILRPTFRIASEIGPDKSCQLNRSMQHHLI
jgi:hypothetical protein